MTHFNPGTPESHPKNDRAMKKILRSFLIFLSVLISTDCQRTAESLPFTSSWEVQPERYWAGPEYWANRLQDWRISQGRLECINGTDPKRTLHLLTHYLTERPGSLQMQVDLGLIRKVHENEDEVYAGFLLCAGDEEMDYRRRAIIHGTHGKQGGMIAALTIRGDIILLNNETNELLPSGLYFIRLVTEKNLLIRKVVLLR